MATWELTGVTAEQVAFLAERGKVERLDADKINITVAEEDEDLLVEWCEENGISCRLV